MTQSSDRTVTGVYRRYIYIYTGIQCSREPPPHWTNAELAVIARR